MTETTPSRGGFAALCLQLATVSVASLVAAGVWYLRVEWIGRAYAFLFWNLFLAWVPWVFSAALALTRAWWARLGLGLSWLVFFPNAPYVVTDFIHYRIRPGTPAWVDLMLFSSFSLAGCVLGWASLRNVHVTLQHHFSRLKAGLALCTMVLLSGLGVYLGRFGRWNSWDVVVAPGDVVTATVAALTTPSALLFSTVFAAFIGAGYVASQGLPLLRR